MCYHLFNVTAKGNQFKYSRANNDHVAWYQSFNVPQKCGAERSIYHNTTNTTIRGTVVANQLTDINVLELKC